MSDYIIDQQNEFDDSYYQYQCELAKKDVSNISNWKELFATHNDFCQALHHTSNPLHEHAKRIKINKDRNYNINKEFDELTQRSIDNYYDNQPRYAR